MRFKPVRVVAFDKRGAPIKDVKWQVEFSRSKRQLVLRRPFSLGAARSFDLTKEVVYLDEQSETTAPRESVSITRTLGRMYLTGLAADKMRQGKFGGAALMDLSIRGAAKTTTPGYTSIYAVIAFLDTSVIHVVSATESEWESLAACIGKQNLGSQHDAAQMVDEVKRYSSDGAQILPELQSDLDALATQIDDARNDVRLGATFADRDSARTRLQFLEQECERKKALVAAVRWELGVALAQGVSNATDATDAKGQADVTDANLSRNETAPADPETTASDDETELLLEDTKAAVNFVLARDVGKNAIEILDREIVADDAPTSMKEFFTKFFESPAGRAFTTEVFAKLSETWEIGEEDRESVLTVMMNRLFAAMQEDDE